MKRRFLVVLVGVFLRALAFFGVDAYGGMTASDAFSDYIDFSSTNNPFALCEFGPCSGNN